MIRIIAHLLILFVLFTHSVMAMDVHIPHNLDSPIFHNIGEPAEHIAHTSKQGYTDNTIQAPCVDAGGHCSHHQAHTSGLVCVNTLSYTDIKSVFIASLTPSAFPHTQTPPLRPPKV